MIRTFDELKFDLGEVVYVVDTYNIITAPKGEPTPITLADIRSERVFISPPIQIVGLKIRHRFDCSIYTDRIWYDFEGGGTDDGSKMFKTLEEAQAFAAGMNNATKEGYRDHA